MAAIYYRDQEGNYVKKNGGGYKGFPMLKRRKEWAGTTSTSTITEVRFVEQYAPDNYDEKWDAGVDPSTITAYREGNVVTVSANGKRKIKLNPGSNGVFNSFLQLRAIKGLEMLDASEVTSMGGMFVYCQELREVDMSAWHLGKITNAAGVFQYCHNLRRVKMPHGLDCDTLQTTESMFDVCSHLVEVDLGSGPRFLSANTFCHCFRLERVTGLGNVTVLGDGAFASCSQLKDVDLNPAILTGIGECCFMRSSMEDCINMDDLNPECRIGAKSTQAARWPEYQELTAIRDREVPSVVLGVPRADCQKKYPDVKFGVHNIPHDDVDEPVVVYMDKAGCTAFSLYHEWQCIHRGTDLEKANFLAYWEDFEGDKFADRNIEGEIGNFHQVQANMLGWTHEEIRVTSIDQYDIVLERLAQRKPTGIIVTSSNAAGYHSLVVVGGNASTGKLLVVDSSASYQQAEFIWIKFEDIFTAADDKDRLIVHNYD